MVVIIALFFGSCSSEECTTCTVVGGSTNLQSGQEFCGSSSEVKDYEDNYIETATTGGGSASCTRK